jgi:hypothetical protein
MCRKQVCDNNCDSDNNYLDPDCENCKKLIKEKKYQQMISYVKNKVHYTRGYYQKVRQYFEEQRKIGCFGPDSNVLMSDGSYKQIQYITRNDKVWTPDGPSDVEFLITLGSNLTNRNMCKLNNTWITPNHPVFKDGIWEFPITLTPSIMMYMPIVYNLILSNGHIIDVGGVLCCTLGHGIKGNVIGHDFFGDKNAILNSIKNQPGFAEGLPVFKNAIGIRDKNNLVVGLIEEK